MRTLYIFCFLVFIPSFCFSQSAKIREVQKKFHKTASGDSIADVVFPVAITGSEAIDFAINRGLISGSFNLPEGYPGTDPNELLDLAIQQGMMELSYTVTFNKSGILSIFIRIYHCGSYCSWGSLCFNFDLNTGKPIYIDEVVKKDSIPAFFAMATKDKKDSIDAYKQRIKRDRYVRINGLDSNSYSWALRVVDFDCQYPIQMGKYTIGKTGLEIIDECLFPAHISALQPQYRLLFPYSRISGWINPEYRKKLKKRKWLF